MPWSQVRRQREASRIRGRLDAALAFVLVLPTVSTISVGQVAADSQHDEAAWSLALENLALQHDARFRLPYLELVVDWHEESSDGRSCSGSCLMGADGIHRRWSTARELGVGDGRVEWCSGDESYDGCVSSLLNASITDGPGSQLTHRGFCPVLAPPVDPVSAGTTIRYNAQLVSLVDLVSEPIARKRLFERRSDGRDGLQVRAELASGDKASISILLDEGGVCDEAVIWDPSGSVRMSVRISEFQTIHRLRLPASFETCMSYEVDGARKTVTRRFTAALHDDPTWSAATMLTSIGGAAFENDTKTWRRSSIADTGPAAASTALATELSGWRVSLALGVGWLVVLAILRTMKRGASTIAVGALRTPDHHVGVEK